MYKSSEKIRYTSPDGSRLWEYLAAISCFSIIFSIGTILGWCSSGLAKLLKPESPIRFEISDGSAMMVYFGIGFTIGPALSNFLADKLGRKRSLLVTTVPIILHWGLIVVAKDPSVLFIARFCGGLSAGLGLCLVPTYLSEIASLKLRGALGMVIGSTTNGATLFIFLAMPYLSLSDSATFYLSLSFLSMIMIWFIPESPYFLVMVEKYQEAEEVLERLRGKNDVAEELELMKKTMEFNKNVEGVPKRKYKVLNNLFKIPANRKALLINFLLNFVLQLGGYVIIMSCGHVIIGAMKTGISVDLSATIIAVIQLVFNILATFVVERFGRKPLIFISGLLSGASTLTIGIYFLLLEHTDFDVFGFRMIPLIALYVNLAALNIGLMPLQLVIQSEILATEIKAFATSLVGVCGGVASIIIGSFYLRMALEWGFGHSIPFLCFPIVTWGCTGLILFLLPETKGKTFLDIQKALSG